MRWVGLEKPDRVVSGEPARVSPLAPARGRRANRVRSRGTRYARRHGASRISPRGSASSSRRLPSPAQRRADANLALLAVETAKPNCASTLDAEGSGWLKASPVTDGVAASGVSPLPGTAAPLPRKRWRMSRPDQAFVPVDRADTGGVSGSRRCAKSCRRSPRRTMPSRLPSTHSLSTGRPTRALPRAPSLSSPSGSATGPDLVPAARRRGSSSRGRGTPASRSVRRSALSKRRRP